MGRGGGRRAPSGRGREGIIRIAVWVVGLLLAVVALDRGLLWMEARGWINYRRTGLSRPGAAYHSLTLQSIFDPRAETLQDARYGHVEEREESGDPPLPEGLVREGEDDSVEDTDHSLEGEGDGGEGEDDWREDEDDSKE